MAKRILLYGATGYSGRLIAEEAKRCMADGSMPGYEVVLGGRDRIALEMMSDELTLPHVVFALDARPTVDTVLSQFDVVLNAAGTFTETGIRLAKSAIATGCQYVDINGEISVYKAMDDLARTARDREVRLVSGAGFTATVSDVMLRWALTLLERAGWDGKRLSAVRVAVSDMSLFSRGSLATMMRSVREEVTVVHHDKYVHLPVGRLERTFDFGRMAESTTAGHQIASAANLLDTCVARELTRHRNVDVASIESYIEMPLPVRLGYQVGAWSSVILHLPLVQRLNQLQIAQLPDGPTAEERAKGRHAVVLQIESIYREPWVDWRMETPNSYDVTARCALAVAMAVIDHRGTGWLTPSEVLDLAPDTALAIETANAVALSGPIFSGCHLEGRRVMAPV
jgi:short subunit dehydrogenase-like uncharacterized protein